MKKLPPGLALLLGTLGIAVATQNAPTPHGQHAWAPRDGPPVLPVGGVQLTSCLPGMPEHWARPQDMPFGPLYGVMDDRVVFLEVMIDQRAFAAGHEVFPVLNDHTHASFAPQREHATYCPPPQGGR